MLELKPTQERATIQLRLFGPILYFRRISLLGVSVLTGRATMALLDNPFLDRIWGKANLVRSFGFPLLKRGRKVPL
jgi:hypothetical protein